MEAMTLFMAFLVTIWVSELKPGESTKDFIDRMISED